MKRLWHLVEAVDDQIDLTALHIQKTHVRGVHDVERDTRGVLAELREHRRKECGLGIVAGHDAHHHLRLARLKLGGGLHGAIHAEKNLFDQRLQLQCPFRGGHALRGAYQQRVVKQRAQSSESVTHGGLRQPQLIRCLGDIALAQQHLQINQQIQINLVEVFHIMRVRRARLYSCDEL